ncbi:MAG: hypothetical protein P8Y38_12795 [Deltaproteobacteria bacterium]|jgi:hypothetical protein
MNMMIKFVLMTAVLVCLAVNAGAAEVEKEVWIDAMSTALPTAFCQSEQFFRQCFDVTQIECEQTAASATRICLEKYKDQIPAVLNQPKDGSHWGRIIGKCAGEAYGIALQKKFKNNLKCKDPSNWQ